MFELVFTSIGPGGFRWGGFFGPNSFGPVLNCNLGSNKLTWWDF